MDFSDVIIGGKDVVVEIDETELGKRKYNRGHHVEGVWVLAGIERTKEKRIFLVELPERRKDTIKEIIEKHVLEGSIIYTDCFKSYDGACSELSFLHHKVNNSLLIKDPDTGINTNTVEGLNNGIKANIPVRNRNRKEINERLWYTLWRRQNNEDLWSGYLNALKEIIYK